MVQCMTAPAVSCMDKLDLDRLNREFETATPQEILSWAIATFPTGLIQTSAFSMLVTVDMLYRDLKPQPSIPVLFLDTLHHFPETLQTVDRTVVRYGLDLHIYRAEGIASREDFVARYGDELWRRDVNQFHYLTKVEPLQRALEDLQVKAWITGRRRDQSTSRQQMPILESDSEGRIKINPLANWTRKDIWNYTYKHDVPYNPLLDQGYTSIGDEPLTTPVAAGEHERAGRWRGTVKTECGIHL
ncbi:MAG: phosphoadenosine phosphosulfate reductase [Cyanobacteria bacterium P01_F01_bin.86]